MEDNISRILRKINDRIGIEKIDKNLCDNPGFRKTFAEVNERIGFKNFYEVTPNGKRVTIIEPELELDGCREYKQIDVTLTENDVLVVDISCGILVRASEYPEGGVLHTTYTRKKYDKEGYAISKFIFYSSVKIPNYNEADIRSETMASPILSTSAAYRLIVTWDEDSASKHLKLKDIRRIEGNLGYVTVNTIEKQQGEQTTSRVVINPLDTNNIDRTSLTPNYDIVVAEQDIQTNEFKINEIIYPEYKEKNILEFMNAHPYKGNLKNIYKGNS